MARSVQYSDLVLGEQQAEQGRTTAFGRLCLPMVINMWSTKRSRPAWLVAGIHAEKLPTHGSNSQPNRMNARKTPTHRLIHNPNTHPLSLSFYQYLSLTAIISNSLSSSLTTLISLSSKLKLSNFDFGERIGVILP